MSKESKHRIHSLACVGVTAILWCASCTSPGASTQGPYAADIEAIYQRTENSFVRGVLMDGVIAESEYIEATEREARCMKDAGLTVIKDSNGTNGFQDHPSMSNEEEMKVVNQCSEQSGLMDIEALYTEMRANPDRVDWQAAERDCLIEAGVLERSATFDDVNRWYESEAVRTHSDIANICSQDALGHLGLKQKLKDAR